MNEESKHRWRILLIAVIVFLLLIAFAYDISRSSGMHGEPISQISRKRLSLVSQFCFATFLIYNELVTEFNSKLSARIACQAPKPSKSHKRNKIDLAY